MNLHVEHHNIKATLTSHGFNYWSETQKVLYFIKGINNNLINTFIANISGSATLRDDFAAAARHVADFIVIMKSCDTGSNCNISGVDTDREVGGGRGHGVGPGRRVRGRGSGRSRGRGGHGVPTHDAVDACTHITKSYYTAAQNNRLIAA